MIDDDTLRRLATEFPGTEEGTSYGTLAFRVGKKLMLRRHQSEPSIVVLLNSIDDQGNLIAIDPETYYITDHYAGHAAVLVRLSIAECELRDVIELAWRRVARKKDLAKFAAD